ncbi:MAG: hypothetical protein Q9218_004878, partial [Villophora microphyllina]
MALIAGSQARMGQVYGHAGAFIGGFNQQARHKINTLQSVGVEMANHPSKFGDHMKRLIDVYNPFPSRAGVPSYGNNTQKRGVHTFTKRPTTITPPLKLHRAHDGIHNIGAFTRWKASIRATRPSTEVPFIPDSRFDYAKEELSGLNYDLYSDFTHQIARGRICHNDPTGFLPYLIVAFRFERMFSLYVRFRTIVNHETSVSYRVYEARVGIDALVYEGPRILMAGDEDQGSGEWKIATLTESAANNGIVYVNLDGEGTIGTLVNGAGLAMNTVDALTALGGSVANFLDTGGKATSATVKTSFSLILADRRVKVVFVNIFGGLTQCDMIAEGIMLAYKDLGILKPVVVRLRGTNEEVGQKMIAESGLPLHAFDDFEEAALKAIELAKPNAT